MPASHRAETPLACPKCGSVQGWIGPRFARYENHGAYGVQSHDYLGYACAICGYEREAPVKGDLVSTTTTWPSERRGGYVAYHPERLSLPRLPRVAPCDGVQPPSALWPWPWVVLGTACALGWYLVLVLSLARMYPE